MSAEEPSTLAVVVAWSVVVLGWLLPLLHVTLSRASGPWLPPPGSRCPLGPRPGWITLVLLLGPLGWLLYWRSRKLQRPTARQ